MRILLVVNAFASSVTARNTVVVHRALSKGHEVEVVETNRRGHATRYAQDAARRGIDVVVAFGGDGTLNEVATGVAGTGTALAVLPGGSTNVFARTIGMPNDPVAGVYRIVAGLNRGAIEPIGLGRANGRHFCFHTGVGYDAAVVREVERRASLKRWFGHPLFVEAALRTWLVGYDRRHPHFTVATADGRPVEGYFTVVLNTNPYSYLGNRPLGMSDAATLDRGLVAVTFRTLDLVTILRAVDGALRHGTIAAGEHIDVRTDLTAVDIESASPFPYQLDGDYLGETTRLEFRHVPDAVRLVQPLEP
ncbi:MAG: diacylglycerol/lipid kinase family protein [Ilumatobacteraceae bacterium]